MSVILEVDHAADGEAGEIIGRRECGVEMVAADIVEIDVDSRLAERMERGRQPVEHRPGLVIDGSIGTQFPDPGAFFSAARCADYGHLARLGDLDHRRTDRDGGGRDEDGVAGFRGGDAEQRSEEHTSVLRYLIRRSYDVFCLE